MNVPRPVVIGGGPAGAACAIHLAHAGVAPLVIEREKESGDALCGGFLSWRTLDQLERIGLSRAELGGHRVTHVRVASGSVEHAIALPRSAVGLSRKRLDSMLLARASELGAQIRHTTARIEDRQVCLGDGEKLDSDSIFLATGKHDLRGLQRPRKAAGADPMTGLRWRIPRSDALRALVAQCIEMHLFDGGYAGLVEHEDGSINLCMAVRKSRLARAGGRPAALLEQLAEGNPVLAERLAYLQALDAFDAVGHVPYHWRATETREGIFRLGDQAGVVASLAGEGIGIALASAADAVRCWRMQGAAGAPAFQHCFATRLRRPLKVAQMVARLGQDHARTAAMIAALPGAIALVARATRI